MKYLAMIYGNQAKWDAVPAEEWPAIIAEQEAYLARYRETGELVGAYGLADAAQAKLVRREGGEPVVTDGPYLETKEYMASFYLFECETEERALRIVSEMPIAGQDPVEVWPVPHESPERGCDRGRQAG
ncbi:YciI family protein [Streptomyces orinoci]|uniref:YciI family protein n=1 Tax=Streptomyces orinoci TaxID=67339 RepID=A0ABV3JYE7_STRON|nr:YciI family protein [Streptomyces orinoci]